MAQNQPKLSRTEQREAARAKARAMREDFKRGQKRRKLVTRVSIVAGALGVVAIILSIVLAGINNQATTGQAPANFIFDGGIKIGANGEAFTKTSTPTPTASTNKHVPNIKIYLDFECPSCGMFEQANSAQITNWVETGAATLEVHPISIVNNAHSGTPNWSWTAGNAALCVANYDPNSFLKVHNWIYSLQPTNQDTLFNTRWPAATIDQLKTQFKSFGIAKLNKVNTCIDKSTYLPWLQDETSRVVPSIVTGTPTILIDGKPYTGDIDPASFAQAVLAAMNG